MKNFFSRNRRGGEILLTLLIVFMTAGYYYLIYIPARENEIIQRRFRTLTRIDENMQEKFTGYISTIQNIIGRFNDTTFKINSGIDSVLKEYNSYSNEVIFSKQRVDSFSVNDSKDSIFFQAQRDTGKNIDIDFSGPTVALGSSGKSLKIRYDTVFNLLDKNNRIYKKHVRAEGKINYAEFLIPLLHKNVFDHYIVFNDRGDTSNSNIIYEDFPSGISFNNVDSLFDSRKKIYTSKIITIETGGEKYLAFLHPCGYNRKNDRIIAGLLKQDTFDKEKRQLPESMVTTILFIALFCFLLLPVIRMALMGKNERIRFFDLFTGYFSFLLLVPVIILVFFWNSRSFLAREGSSENSKKVLADQISRSLNNEIDSTYTLLDSIDSWHTSDSKLTILVDSAINVMHLNGSASAHYFETRTDSDCIDRAVHHLASLLKKDSARGIYPEFVFWLDSTNGKEILNWAFGEDPPRGNYKNRDYFKNARDNNTISFINHPEKNFAFEPVISRIDGKFKFVISKKSRSNGLIVACASRFRSVNNPILPMGYSFSITDAAGKTIFDSDTTNNLNENLLEEFNDSTSFKAVLNTRTSNEFTTNYEDEECNVLAQPIGVLPYFIVIRENTSFDSSLNSQCFSFTIIMMFSFFLFLCVEIIIVFLCRHRQTKLLKNNFDMSWMHPHKSMSGKYFFLFLFNILLLIALALFCFTGFSIERLTRYIFLFIMASLLSSIAACVYKAGNSPDHVEQKRKKRKRNAMIALCVLAISVLIVSWYYSPQIGLMGMLFTATSIALYIILTKVSTKMQEKHIDDYASNFHLLVFSKLLLTSGLPVIVFFFCSYNFEQRRQERLKLLSYAENIEQHAKNGETLESIENQIKNDSTAIKASYIDSVWIDNVGFNDSIGSNPTDYTDADSTCLSLLKAPRVSYNDVSGATKNFELLKPFVSDSNQFFFNNILDSPVSSLQYRITEIFNDSAKEKYIDLSSSGTKIAKTPNILTSGIGFIFWALLITALTVCYQLLKYAINKIFGIDIPDTEDFKALHEKLLKDDKIKYLFVQGIPGSGKTGFIKKHLEGKFIYYDEVKPWGEYNAIIFNLEEIPGEDEIENEKAGWDRKTIKLFDKHIKCIVFTHFEYKVLDAYTNRIKLNLIEKSLYGGVEKIIIASDIDPVEYYYSLKKFIYGSPVTKNKRTEGKKDSAGSTNGNEANLTFLEYINRWNNLLGKFTNIYTDSNASDAIQYSPNSFSEEFLETEFSHLEFLHKYYQQFETFSNKEDIAEDSILKIQSLSDYSYRQIWYSLTKEEQITLYDLAEDGLVNTTNYRTLTMLLNKGLILNKDGVLIPVNHSFRNFILTVVNPLEVKSIEKKITDGQTWDDYKYPVLIILGALIYFVFSSNPEKFGNVLPLVSGLTAGIPTVLKLLSFLKPGEKGSDT